LILQLKEANRSVLEPFVQRCPYPNQGERVVQGQRIIQAATEKLGIDQAKVVINIERFGNTTAATIPLALNDAVQDGRLKKGDLVLLCSVGAGFTVGSVLLRWAI